MPETGSRADCLHLSVLSVMYCCFRFGQGRGCTSPISFVYWFQVLRPEVISKHQFSVLTMKIFSMKTPAAVFKQWGKSNNATLFKRGGTGKGKTATFSNQGGKGKGKTATVTEQRGQGQGQGSSHARRH